MKLYNLLLFSILLSGCIKNEPVNFIIEIDGLFIPSEIGLVEGNENSNRDRYFSAQVTNKSSFPITLATTGEEKFYSPISIKYSYFSEKSNARESGRGINDFFSSEETIISPFDQRKFYFYASISPSTDTVNFLFKYEKKDSICFVETSYLLNNGKVKNQLDYNAFCKN